jgi:hypothetical protein
MSAGTRPGALRRLGVRARRPRADTAVTGYAGFAALLVNPVVTGLVTTALRAARVDDGVDGTAEADDTAERDDPTSRELPDPLEFHTTGSGGGALGPRVEDPVLPGRTPLPRHSRARGGPLQGGRTTLAAGPARGPGPGRRPGRLDG